MGPSCHKIHENYPILTENVNFLLELSFNLIEFNDKV